MTKRLEKAILIRLKKTKASGKNAKTRIEPDERGAYEVQFNPTSLRVTYQNNVDEGGATTQTQRRQNPSTQSATLNFDLEFDTAEETDAEGPVNVRTRTAVIRQFVEPSANAGKDPPPLLKFLWGTFSFVGIVTQLTEDIDLFSPEGRPLRAKVTVAMKEVRADIEAKAVGGGAATSDNATPPGKPNPASGAPGSPPAANPDTAALAQLGESLQQLLARLNADPATWRAAMRGLDSPLGLAGGAQVQFAAGASAGLGLGVSAGFAAGGAVVGTASLVGALGGGGGFGASAGVSGGFSAGAGFAGGGGFSGGGGLAVGAGGFGGSGGFGASAGGSVGASAGFVLAEGGGIAASTRTVASAQAQASVTAARGAFEVPAVRGQATVGIPGVPPPPVDPRAQTFGLGVPLQARVDLQLN